MNADLDLDIPHAHIDLDKYCATLGHKANHSFVANAEWALVEHPRFGLIRGLASLEDIKKDDEILINYQVRPPQLFLFLSQAISHGVRREYSHLRKCKRKMIVLVTLLDKFLDELG